MNFFPGQVEGDAFVAGGVVFPFSGSAQQGADLVYGIRPEHLVLSDSSGIEAEVVVVEPTGSETQVTMRLANQNVFGVFRERVQALPGDILKLSIDPDNVHLFDAESSNRVENLASSTT